MNKESGLTDTLRSNGHIILSYDWRVCAGIPNVGSGLVDSSVPNPQPAQKPFTHNEADRSPRADLGHVGYCHLGTARVWSESLKDCETQAQEFIAANPKYLTRKGLFIYKLVIGEQKEYIKKVK